MQAMRALHTAFAAPARPDHFVGRLSAARDADELIDAVRDYLAAWPEEKVIRVQKLDAGWAPFDDTQRPAPLARPSDLLDAGERVHSQCTALRSAGLPLAPELLELDLFLFLAGARLAEFEAVS